ncbi:MAG: 50S ribosomal protein L21 [Bacillota bacterium]
MYVILETGGKQYRVAEGDTCRVERLPEEVGAEIALDRVLVVGDGENLKVGSPCVAGASVRARVKAHGKGRKIIVYKYKAKKNYRRKQGHRQPYTELYIEKIETGSKDKA